MDEGMERYATSQVQAQLVARDGELARRTWTLALEVDGARDALSVEAAVARVMARHEALRTRFESVAGVALPLQIVMREAPRVEVVALGDVDARAAGRFEVRVALPWLALDAPSVARVVDEIAAAYAGDALGEAVQALDVSVEATRFEPAWPVVSGWSANRSRRFAFTRPPRRAETRRCAISGCA